MNEMFDKVTKGLSVTTGVSQVTRRTVDRQKRKDSQKSYNSPYHPISFYVI
jgi:hypothetical protein